MIDILLFIPNPFDFLGTHLNNLFMLLPLGVRQALWKTFIGLFCGVPFVFLLISAFVAGWKGTDYGPEKQPGLKYHLYQEYQERQQEHQERLQEWRNRQN